MKWCLTLSFGQNALQTIQIDYNDFYDVIGFRATIFLRPPMDVSTERAKQNAILVNKKVKR